MNKNTMKEIAIKEIRLNKERIEEAKKHNDINSVEFYRSLNKVIEVVGDLSIIESYKFEVVENFCQIYQNFDSSRFDKYFDFE